MNDCSPTEIVSRLLRSKIGWKYERHTDVTEYKDTLVHASGYKMTRTYDLKSYVYTVHYNGITFNPGILARWRFNRLLRLMEHDEYNRSIIKYSSGV